MRVDLGVFGDEATEASWKARQASASWARGASRATASPGGRPEERVGAFAKGVAGWHVWPLSLLMKL
jgi:hypothetical protein